jgi:hypothetical protein
MLAKAERWVGPLMNWWGRTYVRDAGGEVATRSQRGVAAGG